jgi:RimJ/RimL family protein N-acetyltransferase
MLRPLGDHIPVLETERLRLRAPDLTDFEHWAAFFASPRSAMERGPMGRRDAWRTWAGDAAGWVLRGYGPWGVEERENGRYLGEVGIYQPDSYPEAELGWFVVPEAEGKGIAFEAANRVLDWARESTSWTRLVNYIDPSNTRSIALALRLGGKRDGTLPSEDPGDVVIRHDLRGAPA